MDQNLVRALGHPLRVEILEVLNQQEASPNMLTKILGKRLRDLAYHIKVLKECGCIELTDTRPRRGAVEHFYRALPESSIGHQIWRHAPRSVRGSVTLASFRNFAGNLVAALKAGMIDNRDDTALSSMTLAFDSAGRIEAAGVMQDTLTRLTAIDAQSRKRAGQHGEELTPYVSGLALFAAALPPSPEGR